LVFLAIANVPLPCYGFSSSITKKSPVASIARREFKKDNNDAFIAVGERRASINAIPNRNNGETCDESILSTNGVHERFGYVNRIQRISTSIFAAILSVVICTCDGMAFQGGTRAGLFPQLTGPLVCHAMTPDQLLVDDVWREVGRQFFDPTFNGQGEEGWKKQRLVALEKTANLGPDDDAKLYAVIRGMLQSLNDPYTRFLTPEQFESMTKTYAPNPDSATKSISKTTSGIGVQLIGNNKASTSGMVVVVNTVAKSPAESAGILPGDSILTVDGVDMIGATAEAVAARCRGETGTTVNIEVESPSVEGVPKSSPNRRTVSVTRTPIAPTPMMETSTVVVPSTNQRVEIVKINSFTQETEKAVRQELKQLSSVQGSEGDSQAEAPPPPATVSAIAIDLRGNVGGYMPAGVDVAKLFLPPRARIVSEVDKTGRATIYINDGVGSETDTTTPLYVLVDEKTASASEILTAALQDNKRAVVVSGGGADKTFGKGRIQNVQALSYGGSGIAITKARYTTPNGRDIQGVGISPDLRSKTCSPKDSAAVCLENLL
jgi:carboxyl-terminal processing protease